MLRSDERVLTTHVGSLPRPLALLELNAGRRDGDVPHPALYEKTLALAIDDIVERQRALGVDIVGDGEFGKPTTASLDYGAWRTYSIGRLSGVSLAEGGHEMPVRQSSPGNVVLTRMSDRRDRQRFADFYEEDAMHPTSRARGVCTGPIAYTGQDEIAADIARFKSALARSGLDEGFMTSIGPASCARMINEYYETDEELVFACSEAMREEYRAIVDAGIVLQIDDPAIAENFDQISPEPSIEDYQRFTMVRVEALNHALRGLPIERIRFHLCFGSWHGPHSTDIALANILPVVLRINAGAYSFEAGNVRHEHEWRAWRELNLPEDKLILPGVVSHATNVLEHPELVAERITRFASLVGRERVVASTDCGLSRVHPQIAWAKLESLAAGAALASRELWP